MCHSYWIIVLCIPALHGARTDIERFIVVSGLSSAIEFYPEIRDWPTQPSQTEQDVDDADIKRQICQDVTGSHLFSMWRECPYGSPSFGYRWKTIRVRAAKYLTGTRRVREDVFECKTRCDRSIKTYYISKEYNLNAGEETFDSYAAGRFIFHHTYWDGIMLHGLAEPSAKSFSSPDHDVERLYLERRRDYGVAYSNEEDALCKLETDEQNRICVAVFNSEYFSEKVTYSDGADPFEGYCRLKKVSFQSEHIRGLMVATGKRFKERMLSCRRRNTELDYLLSHAYQSDQAFVYLLDRASRQVFLENLTTGVRLRFARDSHLSLSNRP